jgi:hypothetical protein
MTKLMALGCVAIVTVLIYALVLPIPAQAMDAPPPLVRRVHKGLRTALAPTVICHQSAPAIAIVRAIDEHQTDTDGGTAAARAVFAAANEASWQAGAGEVCYQSRQPIAVTIEDVLYTGASGWSVVQTDAEAARYAIVYAAAGTEI